MRLSLSTNWFKRETSVAERIDRALALGFGELELGYSTTSEEAEEYLRLAGKIAIGSVHSFCPVPISAPGGHPELYTIASLNRDARAIAKVNIVKNVEFARRMGADTVVLHAGRVFSDGFFPWSNRVKARRKHGKKMMEAVLPELEEIAKALEGNKVTLGLENMPYLEGFPMAEEWPELAKFSPWIKPWFDTGHWRVQECNRWTGRFLDSPYSKLEFAGMHLNDVKDFNDDHFAPGGGKVDFKELADMMKKVPHVVFEPKSHVSEAELKKGVEIIHDAIS